MRIKILRYLCLVLVIATACLVLSMTCFGASGINQLSLNKFGKLDNNLDSTHSDNGNIGKSLNNIDPNELISINKIINDAGTSSNHEDKSSSDFTNQHKSIKSDNDNDNNTPLPPDPVLTFKFTDGKHYSNYIIIQGAYQDVKRNYKTKVITLGCRSGDHSYGDTFIYDMPPELKYKELVICVPKYIVREGYHKNPFSPEVAVIIPHWDGESNIIATCSPGAEKKDFKLTVTTNDGESVTADESNCYFATLCTTDTITDFKWNFTTKDGIDFPDGYKNSGPTMTDAVAKNVQIVDKIGNYYSYSDEINVLNQLVSKGYMTKYTKGNAFGYKPSGKDGNINITVNNKNYFCSFDNPSHHLTFVEGDSSYFNGSKNYKNDVDWPDDLNNNTRIEILKKLADKGYVKAGYPGNNSNNSDVFCAFHVNYIEADNVVVLVDGVNYTCNIKGYRNWNLTEGDTISIIRDKNNYPIDIETSNGNKLSYKDIGVAIKLLKNLTNQGYLQHSSDNVYSVNRLKNDPNLMVHLDKNNTINIQFRHKISRKLIYKGGTGDLHGHFTVICSYIDIDGQIVTFKLFDEQGSDGSNNYEKGLVSRLKYAKFFIVQNVGDFMDLDYPADCRAMVLSWDGETDININYKTGGSKVETDSYLTVSTNDQTIGSNETVDYYNVLWY